MDEFDFEELIAEVLNVTDDEREDDVFLEEKFFDEFEISMEQGYKLARYLLVFTVPIEAGLSGKKYHAFVSKEGPFMLMKTEAE